MRIMCGLDAGSAGGLMPLCRVADLSADGRLASCAFSLGHSADQQPLEALLGAEATQSHVAPAPVIEAQIAGKPAVPFL